MRRGTFIIFGLLLFVLGIVVGDYKKSPTKAEIEQKLLHKANVALQEASVGVRIISDEGEVFVVRACIITEGASTWKTK